MTNHVSYLPVTQRNNGYVSLLTPPSFLKEISGMHDNILVAFRESAPETILGYVITVNHSEAQHSPLLKELAENLHDLGLRHSTIVAQICVRNELAGTRSGIGSRLYNHVNEQRKIWAVTEPLVTEVSTKNYPSSLFHKKKGFKTVHTYKDGYGTEMEILKCDTMQ